MAYVTPDKYSPYPRVCDICGQLRTINSMRKLDGQTWVCDKHQGERTRIMLDTLNAHARPPQTWPNRDAKPQNPLYPNSLEADESALFNFIDQQISNQARYERVTSGDGSPLGVNIVQTMAWSGRYLYDLIVQNTRPERFITRGKQLLTVAADYIYSRQRGFGLVPGAARATDAFWGGVLEPSATSYVTSDIAAAGLALLYAYRVLGTGSYLAGARGAASYLRNVQAIGRYAVQFTSSDSAGTARLYTGAVASEVSTTVGIDAGESFYSTHAFYPEGLITLEFWNELETTDGDQTIGATGTGGDAFISAPSQLLSQSITDMRECWTDGITDSTGTLVVGLSSTTPREWFNAYPATKPHFTITGTGLWEFSDGGAAIGTTLTAQNYAIALGSLYAYEGASTQVTTISDWLRTFTSNEDFETADDTSTADLARATTGDYDPTVSLSTLLQVRDPDDDYAAVAMNGSSLYDWGAFGVLARLWASRNATSFLSARINALNVQQRFDDGTPSDGLYFDRIELRGMSGLTFQTAFSIALDAGEIGYPIGDVSPSANRDAQGTDVEWNNSGISLVEPGTHSRYDVTSIDEPTSVLMMFNDGAGSVCPDGGVVYLHNITGDAIVAEHMAAAADATSYPFFCVGETDLSIADGQTVGFVRVSAIPAWLQVELLTVVNDAVRAAQYGRAFREAH